MFKLLDDISCQVNIRGQHDRIDQLKEAVIQFCNVTQTILVMKTKSRQYSSNSL